MRLDELIVPSDQHEYIVKALISKQRSINNSLSLLTVVYNDDLTLLVLVSVHHWQKLVSSDVRTWVVYGTFYM